MSVLANLSISYESLPGEPSFFTTAHQSMPERLETPQESLSLPYLAQQTTHRPSISNFEFSPSIATQRVVSRASVHTSKPTVNTAPAINKTTVSKPATQIFKQVEHNTRQAARTSRGMFNDFERASLLTYMQRRQFS